MLDDGTIYRISEALGKRTPKQIEEDMERLREAMQTGPVEVLEKINLLEKEEKEQKSK